MKLKKIFSSSIFIILFLALFLRLGLSFFGTLSLDQGTFIAWSENLARNGFIDFYRGWSDYLPGYLYVLWLLGKIKVLLPWFPDVLLYKLPAIIADVVTGFLIYKIVRKLKNEKTALITCGLYVFNPAIYANSTFWGQVDSFTILFSLLSLYFINSKVALAAVFLAIGTVVKPQAALTLFPVLYLVLRDKWKFKNLVIYAISGLAVFIIAFVPFYNGGGFIAFVYSRILVTLNQYPYTSVNAFSIWGFNGFWRPDSGLVFPSLIGAVLLIISALVVGIKLLKSLRKNKGGEYLLLAVVYLAGFLFMTRMHERHLFPIFAPLLISTSLYMDLFVPYFALSLTYLANLYFSFIWITDKFREVFSPDIIKLFIILNVLSFVFLVKKIMTGKVLEESKVSIMFKNIAGYFKENKYKTTEKVVAFPKISLSQRTSHYLLFAILIFALISRVLWLNKPDKEYFDEVYHAFTARLVLHSDPKAWEWWNPNPQGFAYEWTHPPLAKLGMALGMKIMGESAFGWRIPGALLGVGCVLFVYLIAKYLFEDEALALISAFFFSLDGLVLTMSRIGMNDTYMLFFTLLAIYLFLKDKDVLSAFAFGLAVASKWSPIYSVPIFIVALFALKKKFRPSMLWFLIIPPLVYIGSYFQMFLTGHSFDIFIGVQKQMWWYHTNLKATHPYTSPWWSWPFLIRPVYLYTSEEVGGWVARIYNSGNPVVFWFGLVSVVEVILYALLERSKKLGLLAFSYLIFFVPWALSPRIMFFYHYLPSLPFLAIASGYVLRRNKKLIVPVLSLALIAFIYFYPHWAGHQVPLWLDKSYYWFKSWR